MTNKEVTEKVTNRKALLVFWIGTIATYILGDQILSNLPALGAKNAVNLGYLLVFVYLFICLISYQLNKPTSLLKSILQFAGVVLLMYPGFLYFQAMIMYEGLVQEERISETDKRHKYMHNVILDSLAFCQAGSTRVTTLELGSAQVNCGAAIPSFTRSFSDYCNSFQQKNRIQAPKIINAYERGQQDAIVCEFKEGNPIIGRSNIFYDGNTISIITNIGDMNRGDVFISDTVVREEYANKD